MNEKQWETKANALASTHAARLNAPTPKLDELGLARPTISDLRQALVETDRLLRSAPAPIQQRYKRLDEAGLRLKAVGAQATLDEGSLGWETGDPVLMAAAQARALDRHLFEHRAVRGKPGGAANDFFCVAANTHVVPRPLAKPPESASIGTTTYRRRGIVWHRLIPSEIDGYTIDLHWYRDLSLSFRRPGAKVLGSIFEDLALEPDQRFASFVAKAAPCANEDSTLAAQAAAAYAGGVTVALWPELTMPPGRRHKLVTALEAFALDAAPGQGPLLVAAGSWHEVEKGSVRNRMHILSSLGRPRFHHDKSLPLESATLGMEELTPSYRIPVLVAEDALIAFAICRDFCEAQITNVYAELDVDLVVVPSYGDAKTIAAHRQQAHALSTAPGTRAFVVQQTIPEASASSSAGYQLPPEADTGTITAAAMATQPPFSTHPISFKKV